jgi:hypothetical protein
MTETPTPETTVPDGETPRARCPYCDRPFGREALRDLHVGEIHADVCTDAEREAYAEADEQEVDDLFFYHMQVVVVIGVSYALFVLVYMAVLGAT